MPEIELETPKKSDIFSYGFNRTLIREFKKEESPLVYDAIEKPFDPTLVESALLKSSSFRFWTPEWGGSTGSPTIGNGTLSGIFSVHTRTIIGFLNLLWGSTSSTVAAGNWKFSFPIPIDTNQQLWTFYGHYVDTGVANAKLCLGKPLGSTNFEVYTYDGSLFGEGSPFAWATGDFLRLTMIYNAKP